MLLLDLLSLQRREPLQPEIQDGLRLTLGELKSLHQVLARSLYGTALADGRHYFVQVGERYKQSFEDVRSRLGPLELVARPAGDYLELVGDVVLEDLPVRERTGYAVHERHQVHAEALLHLGVLVEVVQHDLGTASRLSSMTTRIPLRSDSSRRSEMSVSLRSLTSSAIFCRR